MGLTVSVSDEKVIATTPPPKLFYPAARALVALDVLGIVTEDDTPVDNIHSEKHQRILSEPLYSSWARPPPAEGVARDHDARGPVSR